MLPRTGEGNEKQHIPGQRGEVRVGGRKTISPRWSPDSPHEAGELSSSESVATRRGSGTQRREDPQREGLRTLADLGDNGILWGIIRFICAMGLWVRITLSRLLIISILQVNSHSGEVTKCQDYGPLMLDKTPSAQGWSEEECEGSQCPSGGCFYLE